MNFWKKSQTIFFYILSSVMSFLVDLGIFTVSLYFLKDKWASAIMVSTFIARLFSSIFNYLVNRKLVFKYIKKEGEKDQTGWQYFALVIINVTISGSLVSKLYNLIHYDATLLKVAVDSGIFVANYFIQKIFIFGTKKRDYSKYVLPLISFVAMFIKVDNKGLNFNYEIYEYFIMPFILVLLYYLYLKIFKHYDNKVFKILGMIFTVFMVVGYSYDLVYSPTLLFKSETHILATLVKVVGYYFLIYNLLNWIYDWLTTSKLKTKKGNVANLLEKHPFGYSFLFLVIVYGIYLVFYYPGVINYDNANQIKEVLGLHTRYLDSIVLLNDNVTLTNFNPIIHTLLLGNFFKLGLYLGNVNLGLFMYTIVQELIIISILSYSISFLKKEGIKPKYCGLVLLIYLLVPFYPFYAMTAVKDSLFYVFVMLYIIKLYQYIKYDFRWFDYLTFMGIMILVILFRNNGIFMILLSLPFGLFLKNKKKIVTLALFLSSIIVLVLYNNILPLFNIPNTSIREALSVPFQQTARFVLDYPDDVKDSEIEVIDKILGYDDLGERYEPKLSDKVKNNYNKYATKEDLKDYFEVWFNMFWRHPTAYFNATVSNMYGYFYPDAYSWYIYSNLNEKLPEAGYDYHFNDLDGGRLVLKGIANGLKHVPILRLVVSCGFYTWAYIFAGVVLILKKKKHLLIILTPAFSLILMCLVGPANTYFRYVLPYAATFPMILCLVLKEVNPNILVKKLKK